MVSIVNVMAGAVLLLAGRRLFWLFVAVAGFYVGFEVTRVIVADRPEWLVWVAAVAAGLIGAIAAALLMDWAIIVLSSMVGATLVVSSLGLGNLGSVLVYAGLMATGIVVQAQLMRRTPRWSARTASS